MRREKRGGELFYLLLFVIYYIIGICCVFDIYCRSKFCVNWVSYLILIFFFRVNKNNRNLRLLVSFDEKMRCENFL